MIVTVYVSTHPPLHLHPLLPEANLAHVVLERVDHQVMSAVGAELRTDRSTNRERQICFYPLTIEACARGRASAKWRPSWSRVTDPLFGLLQVAVENLSDLFLASLRDARDRPSFGSSFGLNVSAETNHIIITYILKETWYFYGERVEKKTIFLSTPANRKWRFFQCLLVLLTGQLEKLQIYTDNVLVNGVRTLGWHLLHGHGRHNGGQLGGAPALHQHHGLFHLHLVVEGDELRLGGALAGDQPLLDVGLIEAVQPAAEKSITAGEA